MNLIAAGQSCTLQRESLRRASAVSGALANGRGLLDERAGEEVEALTSPANGIILCGKAWPSDPDDVPDWIIAAERRRADVGITEPLPYRTRREFEACLARVVQGARGRMEARKVLPHDAAVGFRDHARATSTAVRPITFTDEALTAAYRMYCAVARIECAENFFRAALKRLSGVRREETVSYRPRRSRTVLWTVEPETDVGFGRNSPKDQMVA